MSSCFRSFVMAGIVFLTANNLTRACTQEPAADNAALRWTLSTADTTLTLGVGADQSLCIHELCGPDGWNWTATASPFPLVGRIDVAGSEVARSGAHVDTAVEKDGGMKVTITFANADPAMELKSVWHAHPGPGPVRHAMFIANKSGKPVTIYEQESLDVRVAGPGRDAERLVHHERCWRSRRDRRLPRSAGRRLPEGADDRGGHRTSFPYAVVDAGGAHGVYIGWEWSIGRHGHRWRQARTAAHASRPATATISRPILRPARRSRSRRGSSARTRATWTMPPTACTNTCSTTPCPPS